MSWRTRMRPLSKAIQAARVVAFDDLGLEAIHEFVLHDFPVTVAVDARGQTVYAFAKLRRRLPNALQATTVPS